MSPTRSELYTRGFTCHCEKKKIIKSDFSFSRLDLYMFVNYIWVIKLRKSQPVLFKYVCIYSKITTDRYCIDCLLSGYNNDQN